MSPPRKFISRFSPQRTQAEDLEQIHVQREDLLARSVSVLRESALTGNKHHLLFIGARGSGKTHLLTLIVHRLQQQRDLAEHLRIAWLEENQTSTSFFDLLQSIYRALSERYPAEFPADEIAQLMGCDLDAARELLGRKLLAHLGRRTALILIENLDTLFCQMDETEQRTWRAFLQNHPVLATAATAQRLFAGVANREQPFFGFFDTTHLQPLSGDEAVELLERMALLNQDRALVAMLRSPRGKARVQALHYLLGGNPRLYIILADLLTAEALDELLGPIEQMVDEQLTPYYQERLRWLSAQQRKIVAFLCRHARPVPVKDIAAGLFADAGSIGGQLLKLREMGYVRPNPRGRESFYELAEPLMRLSLGTSQPQSRQPLHLVVEFLRAWFEREELRRLSTQSDAAGLGRQYLSAALGQPDLEPPDRLAGGYLAETHKPAALPAENIDAILTSMFRQLGPPEDWRTRTLEVASLCAQHEALARLGEALVRHLAQLARSPLNNTGLDQWQHAWESAGAPHALLQLPLRLLGAGVAYLKTQPRDESVLLQLPREERGLVREALGLGPETRE